MLLSIIITDFCGVVNFLKESPWKSISVNHLQQIPFIQETIGIILEIDFLKLPADG